MFRVSVALLPRSSVRESKTSLVQQLRTMNDQIAAVEEMSQNIEKDFRNSKMVNIVSYGASKTLS